MGKLHAFFLNCLWIASSASLIVTPFRLRAVTSRPSGKCRSTFLTSGKHNGFFSASLSSTVDGEVFSFLSTYVSNHPTMELVERGEGKVMGAVGMRR